MARADGTPLTVRLTAVDVVLDLPTQLAFTLLFSGPPERLDQGLYELTHARLGRLHLFLAPVAATASGVEYEAAFNLLRESPRDIQQT